MDPQGQLMPIGAVAASNIATALELPAEHVPKIEQAIKDEIGAMSAHFTMAFADIQDQYEIELAKVKSTYSYLEQNWGTALLFAGTIFALGALVGHYV